MRKCFFAVVAVVLTTVSMSEKIEALAPPPLGPLASVINPQMATQNVAPEQQSYISRLLNYRNDLIPNPQMLANLYDITATITQNDLQKLGLNPEHFWGKLPQTENFTYPLPEGLTKEQQQTFWTGLLTLDLYILNFLGPLERVQEMGDDQILQLRMALRGMLQLIDDLANTNQDDAADLVQENMLKRINLFSLAFLQKGVKAKTKQNNLASINQEMSRFSENREIVLRMLNRLITQQTENNYPFAYSLLLNAKFTFFRRAMQAQPLQESFDAMQKFAQSLIDNYKLHSLNAQFQASKDMDVRVMVSYLMHADQFCEQKTVTAVQRQFALLLAIEKVHDHVFRARRKQTTDMWTEHYGLLETLQAGQNPVERIKLLDRYFNDLVAFYSGLYEKASRMNKSTVYQIPAADLFLDDHLKEPNIHVWAMLRALRQLGHTIYIAQASENLQASIQTMLQVLGIEQEVLAGQSLQATLFSKPSEGIEVFEFTFGGTESDLGQKVRDLIPPSYYSEKLLPIDYHPLQLMGLGLDPILAKLSHPDSDYERDILSEIDKAFVQVVLEKAA